VSGWLLLCFFIFQGLDRHVSRWIRPQSGAYTIDGIDMKRLQVHVEIQREQFDRKWYKLQESKKQKKQKNKKHDSTRLTS